MPNESALKATGKGSWGWMLLILLVMAACVGWAITRSGSPPPSSTGDLLVILAPFLAIATAIERFWEAAFDWYEKFGLATARVFGVSAQTATWMKQELANAEAAVQGLVTDLGTKHPTNNPAGGESYESLSAAFQEAEARLNDAQDRIAATLKSPEYLALKRAVTVIGSLILGLIISVSSGLGLFNAAGFRLSFAVDMIVTGLLIGAGPGPLHSFITTLQEVRNAFTGLAELARGSANRRVLDASAAMTQATPQPSVTIYTTNGRRRPSELSGLQGIARNIAPSGQNLQPSNPLEELPVSAGELPEGPTPSVRATPITRPRVQRAARRMVEFR